MINQELLAEQAQLAAGVYMSGVELVVRTLNHLSGRDLSGQTPNGNLRDDFGREIIAAKLNAELAGRVGGQDHVK